MPAAAAEHFFEQIIRAQYQAVCAAYAALMYKTTINNARQSTGQGKTAGHKKARAEIIGKPRHKIQLTESPHKEMRSSTMLFFESADQASSTPARGATNDLRHEILSLTLLGGFYSKCDPWDASCSSSVPANKA